MRRRYIAVLAAVATIMFSGATTAMAAAPTPGSGATFGQCASTVAGNQTMPCGMTVGQCVSTMAQGSCTCQ